MVPVNLTPETGTWAPARGRGGKDGMQRRRRLEQHIALTVVVVVLARRRRPGGQVAQAHGAVERLVAQGERGHGAAAAAGSGSRRVERASAH